MASAQKVSKTRKNRPTLGRLGLSDSVETLGGTMTAPQLVRFPIGFRLGRKTLNSAWSAAQHWKLLPGNVANLQAGLQHAQDGVAIDHTDDVFVGDYGHLVDVLTLHALQDG